MVHVDHHLIGSSNSSWFAHLA